MKSTLVPMAYKMIWGGQHPDMEVFMNGELIFAPDHLKVIVDMYPTDDGWLVYTRVGVEMSDHESSAKTISDALLKLDSWLSRDLARV